MIPIARLKKPLTRRGHRKLADEHARLAKVVRPEVLEGIAVAAAEGDRSENAEYIYGKKRLREVDRRIRYLNSILKDAQIVDPDRLSGWKVCFACTVRVADEEGVEKEWMLVGEGETDALEGRIFWKSPVARALYGRKVGEVVLVQRPAGEVELEILEIRFEAR